MSTGIKKDSGYFGNGSPYPRAQSVHELVRNIRDENYKNCKNMTTQEKIEYTKKLANKFSSYHSEKLFEKNKG